MNAKKQRREIRVLIADDEAVTSNHLAEFLSNNGFHCRHAKNGSTLRQLLQVWTPDFILIDLTLPELNAIELLKMLSENGQLKEDQIRVLVLSGHNNPGNVRECMRHGASDYITKPFKYVDILSRLVLHAQKRKELVSVESKSGAESEYYMYLTELALQEAVRELSASELLHNITRMASLAMKAVRVSVIECKQELRTGIVRASSDKRNLGRLTINLNKYPEILYVLNKDQVLALDNLKNDSIMSFLTTQNKSISFNSMVVCPIHVSGQIYGVFSARLPESKAALADHEIRFAKIMAFISGLILQKSELAAAEDPKAA